MSVLTVTATSRNAALKAVPGKGEAGKLIHLGARTVELAAASSGSTIDFGNIPSNFRIAGCSRVYWDDLATSGSPTLDLGLLAVNSNITSATDALNDGLAVSAVSTANVGNQVVKDIANFGKQAWEYVSGQASDPGGHLKVSGVIRDAATTQTGTVTLDLYGYLD
jgi:phage tail sheath gpL-like